MKVGSLFSGIGGIELGFERAGGFDVKWFVENDLYAQAVLKKHWPSVPVYGDIRQIDFRVLEPVDVLTGGFPCQDISNAGKRVGINGARSGLWKEYLRAIGEIQPKIVFVENVSALTYRGMLTILGDFAQVGYDAEWHCVPASALGAPHRRDRIYIMAHAIKSGQLRKEQLENNRGGKQRESENDFNEKGKIRSETVAYTNSFRRDSRNKVEQGQEKNGTEIEGRSGNPNVAHSTCNRWEQGTNRQFSSTSKEMADCNGKEFSRGKQSSFGKGQSKETLSKRSGFVSNANNNNNWEQCKKSLCEKNRRETWATDARVLRVANGIPNRVDRIKCLGNAVVPQVAEFFAEIIKEKARGVIE